MLELQPVKKGSGVVTTKVILQKEIDIPEALRAKVQLRKSSDGASWVLTLTGLLTAEEVKLST